MDIELISEELVGVRLLQGQKDSKTKNLILLIVISF